MNGIFSEGKNYMCHGGAWITVTKKTRCFITFTVADPGRQNIKPGKKMIFRDPLFGGDEYILVETDCRSFRVFCRARAI